jgi:hypothetical protein
MENKTPTSLRIVNWLARIAVLFVFVVNVQCAIGYILAPGPSAAAFDMSGVTGEAAVLGIAITFLMWNCTYPLVIFNPVKNIKVFVIVLVQQVVGLIGETLIFINIPQEQYPHLYDSISRFVAFDFIGLVVMGIAFIILITVKIITKHKAATLAKPLNLS